MIPGQLPRRVPSGRVALPAARTVGSALASAWAQVTLGIYADALDSRAA